MTELKEEQEKSKTEPAEETPENVKEEPAVKAAPPENAKAEDKAGKKQRKTKDKSKTKVKEEKDKEKTEPADKEKAEEEDEELIARFSIAIPKEEIEAGFEAAAAKYAGEVKLPGFRKGKVPIDVVKSRFKESINSEVVDEMVQQAVMAKIKEEKINAASSPVMEKLDFEAGKDLKADIKVEIFPEVPLPEYFEKMEIEIPGKELEMKEFNEQEQVDVLLENNKQKTPVSGREIKAADLVEITYQSKLLDTKRLTPKKSAEYTVSEKEEFEILDLYKDITGKKAQEKITVRRTYPTDYKKKIWAGKEIEHYIEINAVSEMVKPQLDEKFLQRFGYNDEATFKKKLKEEHEKYKEQHRDETITNHIVEHLIKTIKFPIPGSLLDQEVMARYGQSIKGLKFKDETEAKSYLKPFREQVKKPVQFSLITDAIKEKFKIEADNDELEQEYKRIAERTGAPMKEIRKYYMKPEQKKDLKDTVTRVKIMNFLKEKIKIKEV
ncbi:MAG: trigger factor [Candidatus Aminicenantes bacterium]|nr:trigger factor [Candidatus Aminicenantes bacterium]